MAADNHPLTEARAIELFNEANPALSWEPANIVATWVPPLNNQPLLPGMRAAFDAGREHERESIPLADPHHDLRPWQDCTRDDIREGDLVAAWLGDILLIGVAHDQDEHGDWYTEDGWPITNNTRWPLRRIPAPTPSAVEVELPTEFGAIITDMEVDYGETVRLDRMVWTGIRWVHWDHSTLPGFVTAFTLPDGTRARREGERADGTPRFVKEDDQ